MTNKLILILVGASFLLSLLYSFYYQVPLYVDARAYDTIAQNLANGLGYREDVSLPTELDRSIVRVGPGYEFFLAGVYIIFGHHIEVIWVLQALLLAASVWLTFIISRLVFKENWHPLVGFAAAALVALSPDLILASSMLLTETLSIFLLLLTVYVIFRRLDNVSYPNTALSAFLLGLAFFVRTTLGIVLVVITVFEVLNRRYKHVLLFVFVFLLVLTPWTVRNYLQYHAFIPANLAGGVDLLAGNHDRATGELIDQLPKHINEKYIGLSTVEGDRAMMKDAIIYILSNPLQFAKLTLLRLSTYFSFARPTGWWFHLSGTEQILTLLSSALYSVILFTLGLSGVVLSTKIIKKQEDSSNRTALMWALLFSIPLSIIFIIVETRYRYPVYPLLAIFAGFTVSVFYRERHRAGRIILIMFAILSANSIFDILRNIGRIIERLS
ncbi:MAG: glycosyltransferase family 39 protein [Patescibacteria group bacterium]